MRGRVVMVNKCVLVHASHILGFPTRTGAQVSSSTTVATLTFLAVLLVLGITASISSLSPLTHAEADVIVHGPL